MTQTTEPEWLSLLQREFEQAVIDREYLQDQVVTCSAVADRFRILPEQVDFLLRGEHRKGLVKPHGVDYMILGIIEPRLDSLFQHTAKSGLNPTSDIRAVVIEPASAAAAEKLHVQVGAPLYRLERTRNVNHQAVANQVNFIPVEVCPGLENDDMSRFSFQRLLEEKYHAITAAIKEDLSLDPATTQDQRILDLPVGASVLVINRVSTSITNCPLVWANIHIRPDRYHYVQGLWPNAAALLTGEPSA